MPRGLQIRDGSGNLTFDFTDRTTTILGEVTLTTGSGSIPDARLANGTPFYCQVQQPDLATYWYNFAFSINNSAFSWNFQGIVLSTPVVILYGIY